ncbi:MAG: insulinase family protein [Bacteroidia bacterium]|nr:insulinase family protein [Bacteroidia bacterium]
MIDRTIAPEFKTIDKIDIINASEQFLDNGVPVYSINVGSQELTKVEFVFSAGMYYQNRTLLASTTNTLLEAGTTKRNALQLSEHIDFFGSFLELEVGQDYSSVTIYSLNKYLNESLAFAEEILKDSIFPQSEIDIHLANRKQKHLINSGKVSHLARRKFSELLFGEKHPYGIDAKTEDFDTLKQADIINFYKNHYSFKNCFIVAAGNLPKDLHTVLNNHFGKENWGSASPTKSKPATIATTTQQKTLIEKSDAIQSAIRVGRVLFNKTHEDYFHFQVLNTILGGYFGSRLMANIREDKGYTYGIGSGLTSLVNGGYFSISTEVGSDVTKNALEEIYKEIKILRDDLVSVEELETVRNYILGQFLRSVDGPFALAEKFISVKEFGLDYSYYANYFKAVKDVTPKDIQDLANKYLQEKDLIECVAGPST